MRATMETCSFCCGTGKAERFESLRNGEWLPENGCKGMPAWAITELQNRAIREAPHVFRFHVVNCPQCSGAGEYVVEHFACKIF